MRWVDSLKRLWDFFSNRHEETFESLELETVIPQVIEMFKNKITCQNVIWLTHEQIQAYKANAKVQQGGSSTSAAEQIMYRHIHVQASQNIDEKEIQKIVQALPGESDEPSIFQYENKYLIWQPIWCHKTKTCLAYVILVDVPSDKVNQVRTDSENLTKVMGRHIGFCFQYWAAKKQTFQDDLTELYNQKYMTLVVDNEIYRSQREQNNFSVLFMDVDYFKSVNDTRGHMVGSKLLIEIAKILKGSIRKSDYAFRYGGDEFVVILPLTKIDNAKIAAERLRAKIESSDFLVDGHRVKLTLSIGLAAYPDHAQTSSDIVKMADQAMYSGKSKSRNIVFVAS